MALDDEFDDEEGIFAIFAGAAALILISALAISHDDGREIEKAPKPVSYERHEKPVDYHLNAEAESDSYQEK